ncbi:tRNA (N(6)-L-threonylcarbamoyladenosine(37)-C(2))-methylthiotransferase MtaB [Sphingomonas sp. NSE70-1]|uniref:tRNA (N(6)-L-threonylcarbamoyladenosine(37)-C(2))-methylthiotransferase MtaB n=1 Tax=Sphingomonas caseinilyticus TaxID=2908205 RepID=A0ABT0RRK9_9SPHN|nr:tRNA (N(6)-L-threonylcarbamoyladenosine(37)-C(2))-methylthiotransferase MtaB [Sphingomonas caseinilyticus]MCL6697644.1 tRNA (N(6)-L-threonylcarbamoyladenosine(37)-C(2))-methylthiotransferase MtaB [Sphingomonas caseinilyticus]
MSAQTITLGCRLNFAESEAMRVLAGDDAIIVNSCAVTNEAVRQTRQAIRRAHREAPDKRIIVTGCAAQLDPTSFAEMPEVSRVVGNAEKYSASSFALTRRDDSWASKILVSDVMAAPVPPVAAGFLARVRSFVAVQTGCDHRCTFCSIWQARGASRSLPYEAVRDAVTRELDAGAREIVLTGVDITSFEGGLGPLCQRLLADLPNLQRLRLSSLDSIEIDDALMELVAGEPRLLPHFHLSLQAGDDLILKRMKRRHSRAQAVETVQRLKAARNDVTIGADLIAGFPTESEGAALNSLKLLDDCDIVTAHIFPFSPRPNTPAARMPQLEREIVKARAARLRQAAEERRMSWLDSLIGTDQTVLIENSEKGHSDGFAPVRIAGTKRGDLGTARIIGRNVDKLVGIFE